MVNNGTVRQFVSTIGQAGADRRSRRARRALAGIAAGLSMALLIAACGGTSTGDAGGEPAGNGPDTLTVGFPQEPPNWNYLQNAATAIRSLLVLNILEPLLEKQEDGSLEPLLAESYEVSDDGLVYTFTIREATFHDGSELTADDVVYSLTLTQQSTLEDVSGPFEPVTTIEKVDDRTVRVVLERPSQRFLAAMASDSGLIIPEAGEGSLDAQPVGTGPYSFTGWQNGVQVDLARNDDYWGDAPQFQEITWRFITDANAAVNALLAGDIDFLPLTFAPERAEGVDQRDGFAALQTAGTEIHYASLNAAEPAFDDPRVRQAIAHAIDREAYIAAATPETMEPTCVMVNPATEPWSSDYCPYEYDPDAARQLLSEAGVNGLELRYPYITSYGGTFEVVVQQLADVGITLVPEPLDLATYLEQVLDNADYQFTNVSGPTQIDGWTCPGWYLQDCFEEFDALLAEADASLDRAEWADLRREAVEMHADRAYLIPLANQNSIALFRDDLEGLKSFSSSSEVDLRGLQWSAG